MSGRIGAALPRYDVRSVTPSDLSEPPTEQGSPSPEREAEPPAACEEERPLPPPPTDLSQTPDGPGTTVTVGLLERWKREGDESARARLFERHYPRVLRIVRVRMGPRLRHFYEIEDVVQEVMQDALRGLDRFEARPDASFTSWLASIAQAKLAQLGRDLDRAKRDPRREVRMHALRREDGSSVDFDIMKDTVGPFGHAQENELTDLVDQAVASLPEAEREALLAVEYAGASHELAAKMLGRKSARAVEGLLYRARKHLREYLLRRCGDDPA